MPVARPMSGGIEESPFGPRAWGGDQHVQYFGIEPFVGRRAWGISPEWERSGWREREVGRFVLRGARGHRWPTPKLTARCLSPKAQCQGGAPPKDYGKHRDEEPPAWNCQCGIYASLETDGWDRWHSSLGTRAVVHGLVRLWGRVIECSMGYRAQHAQMVGPLVVVLRCVWVPECTREPALVYLGDGEFPHYAPVCNEDAHHPPSTAREISTAAEFTRRVAEALATRYGEEVRTDGHR